MHSRSEIREVAATDHYAACFDMAAYFDQFCVSAVAQQHMCFEHKGRFYKLLRLPMGIRPAVEVAQAVTWLLVDGLGAHPQTLTDNVRFVGTREDVLDASFAFVLRWSARERWTNRQFAGLIGLLLFAANTAAICLAGFFDLLRAFRTFSGRMQDRPDLWDAQFSSLSPGAFAEAQRLVDLVCANAPSSSRPCWLG